MPVPDRAPQTTRPFAGKVAIVTGAGGGIGRALARGFAADGAQVLACGRRPDTLTETARTAPDAIHCLAGDLADLQTVDRLFAEAARRFGRVDILINNAAVYPKQPFLTMDRATWQRSMNVNVLALAECCRQAMPFMQRQHHGRILNLGSFAWRAALANGTDYAASKAAVMAFTRALAAEIDRNQYPDILVNEFIPGIVKTGMSDEGDDAEHVYPGARRVVLLPPGGPHGRTFLRGELHQDHVPSLLGRARRAVQRLLGGRPQ